MKKCTICHQLKKLDEFNKNKSKSDGLSNMCRPCAQTKSKKYYSKNKVYHKQKVDAYNKSLITKMRKFVIELRSKGCSLCSEQDPCCIDLHHMNDKDFSISTAINHSRVGWPKLIKEINKCVLLCSNCHRKVHKHNIDISNIPTLNTIKPN
jgi:hypothetical protein